MTYPDIYLDSRPCSHHDGLFFTWPFIIYPLFPCYGQYIARLQIDFTARLLRWLHPVLYWVPFPDSTLILQINAELYYKAKIMVAL